MLLIPLTGYLVHRPVAIKLGYIPNPHVLRLGVADYGLAVAETAVVKVLFYFGTLVENLSKNVIIPPEYPNMYRTLEAAAYLDPYNMDGYYFAQAVFTWNLGRIAEVNALLERGLKYRSWDPWLPFYLGFNYAYFLKDYPKAAVYMQQAAERSGNPLFAKLASRYFYESQQTGLGLIFLDTMIAQAKDLAVRKTYQLRRDSLVAITVIEKALSDYQLKFGYRPSDLQALVKTGLLEALPVDPYGGTFYLDEQGRVRTTSKLANIDVEKAGA